MFNKVTKTFQYGKHNVSLETGVMARQATASVLVTIDETVVLVTVVAAKEAKAGQDFFPLTVDYFERAYAVGRIPGGFLKRDGRPADHETLIARLIDRPIRPLFPEGFYNEIQVVAQVLSLNPEVSSDIAAIIGASAALSLSGLPFNGPIGAARVGYVDGQFVLNPGKAELENSALDLVVAGTKQAVLMVESEAKELPEDVMLAGVMFGHESLQAVVNAINEFVREVNPAIWEYTPPVKDEALVAQIKEIAYNDLVEAYNIRQKQARYAKANEAKAKTLAQLITDENKGLTNTINNHLFDIESKIVRDKILNGEPRIDGRDTRTVRPIDIQIGVLPRTHGSALFTRGETQALGVATLGSTKMDEQLIDAISGSYSDRFMLQYNFPPFSTGECGRMGAPKRREIGHGNLAKRALRAVLPDAESFPYSLRVVSEVLESNGSSSMATVCAGCLSLMEAGVPIKDHVAGVAMGLILDGNKFAILTDILGDEDHLGDMDFKVAGTENGITSLQMDIKVAGITEEIMKVALERAHNARKHILAEMANALTENRGVVNAYAPKIHSFKIPTDKIREVIGSGGKVIREIVEKTGAKVSIEDDGTVSVASSEQEKIDAAVKWIRGITDEAEVGHIYEGKVVKVMDFGAFVNFFGSKDGLVHISQLAPKKVAAVSDVVKEGDTVKVKLMGFDDRGKIRLSMKAVDQETGEDLEAKQAAEKAAEKTEE